MSRGKRYDDETKINIKKVLATIVVILVFIMFIFVVRLLFLESQDARTTSENYFTAYSDKKYGVINAEGEVIIEPSYAEYIVIPNSKKDIFICTYDVNYSTGEYKTKALNKKNQEIFTEYEQIEALENYDKNKSIYYEKATIRVKSNGKYGLINIDGKEILKPEYDDIKTLKGLENSILVYKDGKVGLVDGNGKTIIEPIYNDILAIENDYRLGYITMDSEGRHGLVDCNNIKILENKYESITPISGNGKYAVKENGVNKLIEKDGTALIEDKFDEVIEIKNNAIIIKENNKYGVLSTTGEEILKPKYEDIKFGFIDTYIVKDNKEYKLIDKNEKTILEGKYKVMNYYETADFIEVSADETTSRIIANDYSEKLSGTLSIYPEEGYIKVYEPEGYKYYNLHFEEKDNKDIFTNNTIFLVKENGKYGFKDKNGNIIGQGCIYDEATEQNEYGYAAIKVGDKWGSVDKNGNVLVQPSRDLENNPVKDFIGEWNLTEDINMNCYTK